MRVLVLGAGVIGVTSAWYLAQDGHEVTVVDRQQSAGLETSFANGGQISAGQSEPWANPHAPATIVKWLGREDAPLLFRARADWTHWTWGLRFLRECLPGRTRANTAACLALATYSRDLLKRLRCDTSIQYDHLSKGILIIYTDERSYGQAIGYVDEMRGYGFELVVKTARETLAIEPALARAKTPVVGALFSPEDESGDACLFTRNLAELAAQRGVAFRYGTVVRRIDVAGDRVKGVEIEYQQGRRETLTADAYVIALGSYSPLLTRGIGVSMPVYPVKGYSITVPLRAGAEAPSVCLTDESRKMAFSRLGNRLRVAGTAELNGYDTSINEVRCNALAERLAELFPGVGELDRTQRWAGLRPATPGNVPIIGHTRYRNLYLNTGHGTLGWTMACGSGRALADIVAERPPEILFPFGWPA
jgi:D-amino-acid dehydrogenase